MQVEESLRQDSEGQWVCPHLAHLLLTGAAGERKGRITPRHAQPKIPGPAQRSSQGWLSPHGLARVFRAGTHCHCLCPPPSASTVSGSLIFLRPAQFAKELLQLMSHGLQDLEHGNISGGQPGFGGPCPEGRGDTDQSSVQEGSCQTRGVKWSGDHGNLKHCQGPEEARAGGNSGTDLGLLSRTQTWRGCQGT